MVYKSLVKEILKNYNVSDQDVIDILRDIEKETGHNVNLIKAVIDLEREGLIKRLKKKKKKKEKEVSVAYA